MSATLEEAVAAEAPPASPLDIWMIPLGQLHPAKDNPRADVGDVTELAASIKAVGLLEPLVVMPQSKGYLIVCGARRHAAARMAGLQEVPAIVREFTEADRVEAMLIENLQREDLSVLEEAEAYARLVKLGLSQRRLAERVGRSQSHVSKRLALVGLPPEAAELVVSGGITLEDAQELAKLPKKAIPGVVADAKRYGANQAHYSILQATRAVENEKKVKALLAELEANGEPAVTCPGSYQAPRGHAIVDPRAWNPSYVKFEIAAHKKQPCHVVGVQPDGGAIELCSDPKRHPQPKPDATPKMTKEQREEKRQREELESAGERRRAFVRELIAGKVSKDDLVAIALPGLLKADSEGWALAGWLLRVDLPAGAPDEEPPEGWPTHQDYLEADPEVIEAAFYERAAKSTTERLRVSFAAAAAELEQCLIYGFTWGALRWTAQAELYLDVLRAHGYEISSAETTKLEADLAAAAAEASR